MRGAGKASIVAVIVALIVASALIYMHSHGAQTITPVPQASTKPRATQSGAMTPMTTTTNTMAAASAKTMTLVDALGRRVTVPAAVERIAVINGDKPGYITTLDAVGGPEAVKKIVAMSLNEWRKSFPGLYKEYTKKFPSLIHVMDIGSPGKGTFNVEKLIEAKPSVVVAPAADYKAMKESGALERLKKADIPVVFVDLDSGHPETVIKSIEVLGKLLGSEERAKRIANWYRSHYMLVEKRLSDIIDTPSVYIETNGSARNALEIFVSLAKGRVSEAPSRDTDVVVATATGEVLGPLSQPGRAATVLAAFEKQAGIRGTLAAKHAWICMVYGGVTGGAWSTVGLEYVAKALHPAVFRDIDPTADLKAFYREFLSVPFKGSWFACLNQTPKMVTVVDALGRKVTVPSPARRIAVLYGLEDLVAVGGEPALARLVALNVFRYKKWRPDWWTAWVEHFPWLRNIPDVGQPGYSFDLEKLVEARPDVVITAPWMYRAMQDSGALKKLSEAHIPVVVIDFVPSSTNIEKHLEAVERSLEVLGAVTGYPERAASLYNFYVHQVMLVINKTKGLPEKDKPGVIVFATWSKWRVYGARSPYNVWITLAGGRNLAAKAVPGSSGEIDPEYVLEAKPQVIVFTCNNNFYTGGGTVQKVVIGYTARSPEAARKVLEELVKRPGWETLPAVRDGRVYMLYHGLSHGHVFQFAALQWLAKWLHPELFKNLDPLKNLEEFYEKYMPYPLRGVWAVGIREAAG